MSSKPDLVAQVVAFISNAVEIGHLRPGDRLPPERALAQHLGVSRSTVRNAVHWLAASGVVRIRHSVGNFIENRSLRVVTARLQAVEVLHGFEEPQMFEARRILEGLVSTLAAARAKEAELARISEEIAEMYASVDNPTEYLIHDLSFHRRLAEASGNPILAAATESINRTIFERRQVCHVAAADLKTATQEHHEIYRAIRAHDAHRAHALMTQHLRRTELEQFQSSQSDSPRAEPV